MRTRLLFVLSVVATVVATPVSAAPTLERHAIAGERASFGVPAAWVAIDGRELVSGGILDQLARENPRLAPFVRSFAQAGAPLKFVALDPRVRGRFATNVNVVAVPVPTATTFDVYRQALLQELRAVTRGGKVAQSVVRVGGNQAVRVSYRFRLTAAGRTFTAQTLQYAFLRGGKSLVFTYTTLPRLAATYAKTFAASASSIRFR
jgi:hypothetical protein